MNLYIMRHGETNWNLERRLQGVTENPLNEAGVAMTEETLANVTAEGIKFDLIYSSPLSRAVETAKIMNRNSNVQIILDNRIIEFGFGGAEGKRLEDMQKDPLYKNLVCWFTDPSNYKPDLGAESLDHFMNRVKDFIDNEIIPLEGKFENVLVTGHGGITRGLLCYLENRDASTLNIVQIPNCGINKAVLKNGKFTVEYKARKFYQETENGKMTSYDLSK